MVDKGARMREKDKFDAIEKKEQILAKAGYQCGCCGRPATSLAHRIAKTKSNLKKYGAEVIHHEYNLVAVCESPACNDSVNIGNNPAMVERVVRRALRVLREAG